jgi:hypothetical protein
MFRRRYGCFRAHGLGLTSVAGEDCQVPGRLPSTGTSYAESPGGGNVHKSALHKHYAGFPWSGSVSGYLTTCSARIADDSIQTGQLSLNGIDPKQLSQKPGDLGLRITYRASAPPSEAGPDCDFAVPFA